MMQVPYTINEIMTIKKKKKFIFRQLQRDIVNCDIQGFPIG